MHSLLATSLLSSLLMAPAVSFACGGGVGWANPDQTTPKVSLADAIATAKSEFGFVITKSEIQSKCGADSAYDVVDAKLGKSLGSIPVAMGTNGDDGRSLLVRAQQLSFTPVSELIALQEARTIFRDDVKGLEEDLGIGAYVPNAFTVEKRTENNGQKYLVFVQIKAFCDETYYESPSLVYQGFPIKTLEYIPGRINYSADSIYQKGDLKRALLADQAIMAEIKKRISSNARYCEDDDHGKLQLWKERDARLQGKGVSPNLSSFERFSMETRKASSAYMVNSNRIAVEYGKTEKQFGGTIDEMVAIQGALSKQGVSTDKLGRLNWEGKIQLEVAIEQKRVLPASLRD